MARIGTMHTSDFQLNSHAWIFVDSLALSQLL